MPRVAASIVERQVHPIDRHVGAVLQKARLRRGWRQGDLAARLGVTFQQVQKYESGETRLSASTLVAASRALDLTIETFFADLPDPASDSSQGRARAASISDFLALDGARDLAARVSRLPCEQRQAVLTLMRSLAVSPPLPLAARPD